MMAGSLVFISLMVIFAIPKKDSFMGTTINRNILSIQLADLAEELNGNLRLSIGHADLDMSLERLRDLKSKGQPTDFETLFTMALVSGGYNQQQCQDFYRKMEYEGYTYRLSFNPIDDDTPFNFVPMEAYS